MRLTACRIRKGGRTHITLTALWIGLVTARGAVYDCPGSGTQIYSSDQSFIVNVLEPPHLTCDLEWVSKFHRQDGDVLARIHILLERGQSSMANRANRASCPSRAEVRYGPGRFQFIRRKLARYCRYPMSGLVCMSCGRILPDMEKKCHPCTKRDCSLGTVL